MKDGVNKNGELDLENIIAGYPQPIIATFTKFDNTRLSESRIDLIEKVLIDAAESVLEHVSIFVIAKYLADKKYEPKIHKNIANLARPSTGKFSGLLRQIIDYYKGKHDSFMDKLITFYCEDEMDDETFDDLKKIAEAREMPLPDNARDFKQLFDIIATYRNSVAHGKFLSTVSDEERMQCFMRILMSLLKNIKFLAQLPLLEVQSVNKTPEGEKHGVRNWNRIIPKPGIEIIEPPLTPGHLYIILKEDDSAVEYIDLAPFYIVINNKIINQEDIYILSEFREKRIEYHSRPSDTSFPIKKEDPRFNKLYALFDFHIGAEEAGVPEYLLGYLAVIKEESKRDFNNAIVELEDGNVEIAIKFLEHAISESPGYVEARIKLAEIYDYIGQLDDASSILEDYTTMDPSNRQIILCSAKIFIKQKKMEKAKELLYPILEKDPNDTEALYLLESVEDEGEEIEKSLKPPEITRFLPYEIISVSIFIARKNSFLFWFLIILLLTIYESFIFYIHNDLIMASTMFAIGGLWITTIWAAFRIRKLLAESKSNFAAFIKLKSNESFNELFDGYLNNVFGKFPSPKRGIRNIISSIISNKIRFIMIGILSAVGTLWLFKITKYSPFSTYVDISYGIYGFFFFNSFLYIISIVIQFQKQLRELRVQQIHFSLAQHPKLSIRYLSHLSRKISYPLLAVYTLASLTLYMGPFLSNILFIFALSALLIVSIITYYGSIFLVRSVIIRNKWSLISRFSVHFDTPFNLLVNRAKYSDLKRITELVEIRDFIDSMDVWAEKRLILLSNSIIYLIVIIFATVILSNAMTRVVMPKISRNANITILTDSLLIFPWEKFNSNDLQIRVMDVDDAFFVGWGTSIKDLSNMVNDICVKDSSLRNFGTPEGSNPGYRRCDWTQGNHGNFVEKLEFEDELHILAMAYNKVFTGLPLMGGGKLSYDFRVLLDSNPLFRNRRFIRFNTRELGYVTYLHLEKKEGKIIIRIYDKNRIDNHEKLKKIVNKLLKKFANEDSAAWNK